MNPLLNILIYVIIGLAEWWLALRRTLACVRQERTLLVTMVFIENFLGLVVLQNFIRNGDWYIAIAYSIGGALGALFSTFNKYEDI